MKHKVTFLAYPSFGRFLSEICIVSGEKATDNGYIKARMLADRRKHCGVLGFIITSEIIGSIFKEIAILLSGAFKTLTPD